MRIAIVEDRPEDRECLSYLLAEDARGRGWTYTVETYTSGEAFLEAAGKFEIVFLDVMMDGIDGLETARRFRDKGGSALVVFVTVEADFAIEGYEVDAAAFLIKPANAQQLHHTLDRLEQKLMAQVHKNGPLVVLSPGKKLLAGTVLYAIIKDHYLKVYADGKMFSPNLSMEGLRSRLPDDGRFVECSRGVLVNLDHISKVETKSVTMDDGTRLPVSRRRWQTLVGAIATRKFNSARADMS